MAWKNIPEGFANFMLSKNSELYQERKSICESCPDLKGSRCGICNCPIQTKARVKNEKCPKDKW